MNKLPIPVETLSKKELALEKAGVTREKVIISIKEHLVATVKDVKYDENGREIVSEVPNYPVQEKAQEKLVRILEMVKPEGSTTVTQVTIGASANEVKELMSMALDVKEQLLALRASGKQTGEVIDI